MYVLYIVPTPDTRDLYIEAAAKYLAKPYGERDAGFDLFSEAQTFQAGTHANKLRQNVCAGAYDTERGIFRAYWMLPRSSISKSPLRLANSVGLIDAGYRGTIMAMVDAHSSAAVNHGDRYFQLSAPDLLPWDDIQIVDEIPGGPTLRGAGGFGSTGK